MRFGKDPVSEKARISRTFPLNAVRIFIRSFHGDAAFANSFAVQNQNNFFSRCKIYNKLAKTLRKVCENTLKA